MKIVKILGILSLALLAGLLILGLFAPKEYSINRTIEIDVPKAQVYRYINNFEKRVLWYPWNKRDPNLVSTIEGNDGEIGAKRTWAGNEQVGKGYEVLTAMKENESTNTLLVFQEPRSGESDTYVNLSEANGKTKVDWGFGMTIPYPFNAFAMLQGVDLSSVEADFDEGLSTLKSIVEGEIMPNPNALKITEIEMPKRYFLGVKKKVKPSEITAYYTENLPKCMEYVMKNKGEMDGMPCGLYYSLTQGESDDAMDLAAAIPIKKAMKVADDFESFEVAEGKALHIDFYGNYTELGNAHKAMETYMKANNLSLRGPAIEQYVTDPTTEPDPNKWLTKLSYPVK